MHGQVVTMVSNLNNLQINIVTQKFHNSFYTLPGIKEKIYLFFNLAQFGVETIVSYMPTPVFLGYRLSAPVSMGSWKESVSHVILLQPHSMLNLYIFTPMTLTYSEISLLNFLKQLF